MTKYLAIATALALAASAAQASGTVTPINALERGTMVTVEGVVTRITDEDEFRLTDETGTVRVYVGPNWVPADVGEAVWIDGFVDDNSLGPLEIYARSLTRADGTVVILDRGYE